MITVQFGGDADNHERGTNLQGPEATPQARQFRYGSLNVLFRILGWSDDLTGQTKLGVAVLQNLFDLRNAHDSSIARTIGQANFGNLDGEFMIKITHPKELSPKGLFGGERIDT